MAKGRNTRGGYDRQRQSGAASVERRRETPAVASRREGSKFNFGSDELIYGRRNYIIIGVGIAFIAAGLMAMAGGAMPSPDVWDDSIIYSFRRITLAPMLMLLGFGIVGYGIFADNGSETKEEYTTAQDESVENA